MWILFLIMEYLHVRSGHVCIFLCTETASTVSFSLCCSQVERECGVQPLFCFSSDMEGSMEEKLFKVKEGSKNSIFCQGKVKFSGQAQGQLTCIQLVNFILFCICLVCQSFRFFFLTGKRKEQRGGFASRDQISSEN